MKLRAIFEPADQETSLAVQRLDDGGLFIELRTDDGWLDIILSEKEFENLKEYINLTEKFLD